MTLFLTFFEKTTQVKGRSRVRQTPIFVHSTLGRLKSSNVSMENGTTNILYFNTVANYDADVTVI